MYNTSARAGPSGLFTTPHGLRVAYLSGRYEPALFDADRAAEGFTDSSSAVTKAAVDALVARSRRGDYRGTDVFLTSAWPARVGAVRMCARALLFYFS